MVYIPSCHMWAHQSVAVFTVIHSGLIGNNLTFLHGHFQSDSMPILFCGNVASKSVLSADMSAKLKIYDNQDKSSLIRLFLDDFWDFFQFLELPDSAVTKNVIYSTVVQGYARVVKHTTRKKDGESWSPTSRGSRALMNSDVRCYECSVRRIIRTRVCRLAGQRWNMVNCQFQFHPSKTK